MNRKTWNSNVPQEHCALMLRTCNADGTSRDNFKWPKKGYVSCEDWKPTAQCGNGLHGLLRGEGDPGLLSWNEDALWQAVEVDLRTVVGLHGKVKVPYTYVVHTGTRKEATDLLVQRYPHIPIPGAFVAVGDRQQATAGYYGTATAGNYGTATAGYGGTATAGYGGTLQIKRWDDTSNRYRIATAYVGEGGILPGVPYRLDDNGKFVRADEENK